MQITKGEYIWCVAGSRGLTALVMSGTAMPARRRLAGQPRYAAEPSSEDWQLADAQRSLQPTGANAGGTGWIRQNETT